MDIKNSIWSMMAVVMALLVFTGCKSTESTDEKEMAEAVPTVPASPFNRPGFYGVRDDGRLWVFRADSEDLEEFLKVGEPAKSVTLPGRGPSGMTIRGVDKESIYAYMYNKPGFEVFYDEGRLWVFRTGSEDMATYLKVGEPAKSVTLPGRGPKGMTIRSSDRETIDSYMYGKPGYEVFIEDGRMWVFEEGSEELATFKKVGEPAKSVTLPGRGPKGMTIRSSDRKVIDAYTYGKPGFDIDVVDGRIWVFMEGSEAFEEYSKVGEPAKSVTLPGRGPNGMTIRGADREVIEAYMVSK